MSDTGSVQRNPSKSVVSRREKLPLMPIRNAALLPGNILRYIIGRKSSQDALNMAFSETDKHVFAVAQKEPTKNTLREAADVHEMV